MQITSARRCRHQRLAAPEVEHPYTRARELCRSSVTRRSSFRCCGDWAVLSGAGVTDGAQLGEQLLRLAQPSPDPAHSYCRPTVQLGGALYWRGELAAARTITRQGLALYDPRQHRALAFLYGEDPGGLRYPCGLGPVVQGYPDQALTGITRSSPWPRSIRSALAWPGLWSLGPYCISSAGRGTGGQERAEAAMTLSTEQGFPHWLAVGTFLRGWALAAQGQGERG